MTSISLDYSGSSAAIAPSMGAHVRNTSTTCAVVRTRDEFAALEADWNDLFARSGAGCSVFQTFNWCWHWTNHYLDSAHGNCALSILTVRRAGRLVALWPLMTVRSAGAIRIGKWLGEPASQYGDALIDSAECPAEIAVASLEAMLRDLDVQALHLRKVRADARAMPLLTLAQARVTAEEEAPYLSISSAANFDAYEQRYSSKARKNRRRLARRLAGHGGVTFERLTQGPAARAAAHEAIAMKLRSLEETGRVSPAMADPRFASFFADAAEGGDHACGCGVSRMLVGGKLAASAIDVTANSHRAAHLIVHDSAYDDCGAGMLMMEHWIRTACDDGVRVFDLLAPAHTYKDEWADGSMLVRDFAIAATPAGRLIVAGYYGFLRPQSKMAVEWAARTATQLSARLHGRKSPRACDGKRPSAHTD